MCVAVAAVFGIAHYRAWPKSYAENHAVGIKTNNQRHCQQVNTYGFYIVHFICPRKVNNRCSSSVSFQSCAPATSKKPGKPAAPPILSKS